MGRNTFGLVHRPRATPVPTMPARRSSSRSSTGVSSKEKKQLRAIMEKKHHFRSSYYMAANYQHHDIMPCKQVETDDEEDVIPKKRSLESCVNDLFLKKGPKRENALTLILEQFTTNIQTPDTENFLDNNYVTLLSRCLNCIKSSTKKKSGSTKEALLASRIIVLMTLAVGCGERAHEILESSISNFAEALEPKSDPSVISCLLDSLAIITVVGGYDTEETERSMQIIWKFLQEKLVVSTEHSTQVIISAISAWSFLLASMERWNISSKHWKGAISYFSNLLGEPSRFVRAVAGETLALILEIGAIHKFSNEDVDRNEGMACNGNHGSIRMQESKEKILSRVKSAVVETSSNDSSGKVSIERHRGFSSDTMGFLKKGCRPNMSLAIGLDDLHINSWSKLIQVDFMRWFLGSSFVRHVKRNELFQDFFDFTLTKPRQPADDLYVSNSENDGIRYVYKPEMSKDDPLYQRLYVSQNSILNKAKTQLMNKQRMLSEAKNAGHFSVCCGDE